MVSSPKPPDPYATAAAQTASNKETANYQQSLNMVNQITPYGSVNYNQTGTASTGAPTYTATTQLSPELKGLVDTNIGNSQGNANLEGTLLKNSTDRLSQPLDLSWGATESNLDALGRKTIDPQFQQAGDQLEQKLYSQGLRPGQAAYDQQMTSFNNNKNAAYNNLYLTGHQTAVNDISQTYNSPLNALNALRSGSQVSQPGIGQTAQTPQTGVQGTNISGLIEQNYQQQAQQSQATMGGLFGLGGTALNAAMMFSDRRLKRDIVRIGALPSGLGVYEYTYLWSDEPQVGVMADEARELFPEAVSEIGGYLAVDYGKVR